MKKTFLIISVIYAFAFSVKSQNTPTSKQLKIQKTITEMFQGFADLNTEKIKRNCTVDVTIFENGVV